MISREPLHFGLSWFIWKLDPWALAARRTNKKTQTLVYFCIRKKKPYGRHWACLGVSVIEKRRDGNSAVLGCRAVYMAWRWRVEFVWVTIFLAILVNFNVSTAESCFHWQKAGPNGHILSYREKQNVCKCSVLSAFLNKISVSQTIVILAFPLARLLNVETSWRKSKL
jgi:hypothetical protein